MASAANVHFVRSTRVRSTDVLSVGGVSVWSACEDTFRRIDSLCGADASRVFAEPNVKQQADGELNVAWFGSFDDVSKQLDMLDRGMRAHVEADLTARLAALRPALDDPEIGETVAAMLNLYDDESVVAVSEHAVLTNWGVLPANASASQAAFRSHSEATIAPFLSKDVAPRIPGLAWVSASADIAGASSPRQTHATPTAGDPPSDTAPVVAIRSRFTPLWPPAALAALFAVALLYAAWPGNLVYEKINAVSPDTKAEQLAVNDGLKDRIAKLKAELGKKACEANPALLGIPLNSNTPILGQNSGVPDSISDDTGNADNANNNVQENNAGNPVHQNNNNTPDVLNDPKRKNNAPSDTTTDPGRSLIDVLDSSTVLVVTPTAIGSGFYVTPNDILTNRHVIEGSNNTVFVASKILGKPLRAQIVAASSDATIGNADFALLRVNETTAGIKPLSFSTKIERNDNVVAGGFPAALLEDDNIFQQVLNGNRDAIADLELVATQGSILVLPHNGAVQKIMHSASIAPGNSGGPLVDACGRAVGINTFTKNDNDILQKLNYSLSARDAAAFLAANNVQVKMIDQRCDQEKPPVSTSKVPEGNVQ